MVMVKLRDDVKFFFLVDRIVMVVDVKYVIERGFFDIVNSGYVGVYFGDLCGVCAGVKFGIEIVGLEVRDVMMLVFHLTQLIGGVLAVGALVLLLIVLVLKEYVVLLDCENLLVYGCK